MGPMPGEEDSDEEEEGEEEEDDDDDVEIHTGRSDTAIAQSAVQLGRRLNSFVL